MNKILPLFALVLVAACQKAEEAPAAPATEAAQPGATEVVEVPAE